MDPPSTSETSSTPTYTSPPNDIKEEGENVAADKTEEDASAAAAEPASALATSAAEPETGPSDGAAATDATVEATDSVGAASKMQHASAPKAVPYSRTAERAAARSHSKEVVKASGAGVKEAAAGGECSRSNSNGSMSDPVESASPVEESAVEGLSPAAAAAEEEEKESAPPAEELQATAESPTEEEPQPAEEVADASAPGEEVGDGGGGAAVAAAVEEAEQAS